MNPIDETPRPTGELTLQTVAMPADTNANGDIFGGWLLSQMDIAGGVASAEVAGGRVATVAVQGMAFLTPVHVGAVAGATAMLSLGKASGKVDLNFNSANALAPQAFQVYKQIQIFKHVQVYLSTTIQMKYCMR